MFPASAVREPSTCRLQRHPSADAELAATAEGCSAICVVIALAALCWAGVIGFALFVNGLVRL